MAGGGRRLSDGGTACGECEADVGGAASFCPECGAPLGETLAEYCQACGGRFAPDDRFCSDCGAARNPEKTAASAHDSASPDEDDAEGADEEMEQFRARVQSYLGEGWELEHDYGDSVVLVDRSWGHPLAHVALLLLTGGFGNIIYAWYTYKEGAERRRLSADEAPADPAPVVAVDEGDEEYGGTGRTLLGVFLLLLGLLFVVSDPLDPGNWLFGLVVLAGGRVPVPAAQTPPRSSTPRHEDRQSTHDRRIHRQCAGDALRGLWPPRRARHQADLQGGNRPRGGPAGDHQGRREPLL
jgi:hypothetical protein